MARLAAAQAEIEAAETEWLELELLREELEGSTPPRHVVFIDGFPMTESGKIRKAELREGAKTRFAA